MHASWLPYSRAPEFIFSYAYVSIKRKQTKAPRIWFIGMWRFLTGREENAAKDFATGT
jgi:hypothetical protein